MKIKSFKQLRISLVIPCFNEERNIRLGALEKVSGYLQKSSFLWDVIIVDDGSRDMSGALIRKFIAKGNKNFRLVKISHEGKAVAVMTGVREAKGDFVLFSDMDQATPLEEVEKLALHINDGYKVIIGSRNAKRRGAPFFRLLMARGFMIIRNIILDLGIRDTQCGFKMFEKKAAGEIFQRLYLYKDRGKAKGSKVTAGFDVEILFIAKKLGYRIKEVPVEWHYQETRHVNLVRDSLDGLRDLAKIKILSLQGKYGK